MTDNTIDIRCCDCLDLLKSLPDKSVDLIVTDPPYVFEPNGGGGGHSAQRKNNTIQNTPESKEVSPMKSWRS